MSSRDFPPDFDVGGRRLSIRHLDRVLFPETGTTKAQVLDYYIGVADVMLPHLAERPLHMHRYPEGVGGPRFWQKGCPDHRPPWVPLAPVWIREKNATIDYCVVNELATLLWAVNLGSIELHTSLHRRQDVERPTALAFDLDPGEGTGILECGEVALRLRDLLDAAGAEGFPKTSGSKGLQVYAALDGGVTYDETKALARGVAELLETQSPELVVSRMGRALRAGKVLVDWGQNTTHKSMVCAYSVRAKATPTVSTPLHWAEIEEAVGAGDASALSFDMDAVRERIADHGDLFAGVLARGQRSATTRAPR